MSKRKMACLIPFLVLGITLPVYGVESSLDGQGSIVASEEQIIHMNEDLQLLENQIDKLNESIKEEVSIDNSKRKSRIKSKGNGAKI